MDERMPDYETKVGERMMEAYAEQVRREARGEVTHPAEVFRRELKDPYRGVDQPVVDDDELDELDDCLATMIAQAIANVSKRERARRSGRALARNRWRKRHRSKV